MCEQPPSGGDSLNLAMRNLDGVFHFNTMQALEQYALDIYSTFNTQKSYDVVCEVAGGEARCTRILSKHFRAGRNFDLVTGCDLTKPEEQAAFMRYRQNSKVLVALENVNNVLIAINEFPSTGQSLFGSPGGKRCKKASMRMG